MQQPALIIMAAGLGSRFGGLKQIEPVGDRGEIIMDYSLYDARRAGFRKVIFVVKKENEADLRAKVEPHIAGRMEAVFARQELEDLPEGFSVPEGRVKPWGTAHAVRSCRGVVNEPFAVINADDFYGPTAFAALYDFLTSDRPETENAMVGYRLRNTVTENGSVARGICEERDGYMTSITERTRVEKRGDGVVEHGGAWLAPARRIVKAGTWRFAANGTNAAADIALDGGGLEFAAGTTNVLGRLSVSAPATLAFEAGARVEFSDSAAEAWSLPAGGVVNITGMLDSCSLRFGTSKTLGSKVRALRFNGMKVHQSSDGYILPGPEGVLMIVR